LAAIDKAFLTSLIVYLRPDSASYCPLRELLGAKMLNTEELNMDIMPTPSMVNITMRTIR
jgi:hypothetical protein